MKNTYLLMRPENIEDEDFKKFLVGRKRVPMKEAESHGLLRNLKRLVEDGSVTVDTTVQQRTAVKKVRMIQMEEEVELQRIKETLHQNAKRQIELINWMIELAGKTVSAKQLLEETGVQSPVLKALIDRGAAYETFEEVYREPDASKLQDGPIPDQSNR